MATDANRDQEPTRVMTMIREAIEWEACSWAIAGRFSISVWMVPGVQTVSNGSFSIMRDP